MLLQCITQKCFNPLGKILIRTSFDVTTKPDVETTLVISCIWKFPGRLFTSRRFHDVVTTLFTSRCRHNVSTTFATSNDVRKTFIYNQMSMFFRRRVSTGDGLPSGKVWGITYATTAARLKSSMSFNIWTRLFGRIESTGNVFSLISAHPFISAHPGDNPFNVSLISAHPTFPVYFCRVFVIKKNH